MYGCLLDEALGCGYGRRQWLLYEYVDTRFQGLLNQILMCLGRRADVQHRWLELIQQWLQFLECRRAWKAAPNFGGGQFWINDAADGRTAPARIIRVPFSHESRARYCDSHEV